MKYLLWIIGLFLTFFAQAQETGQCKHALNQQQWAKNQVQFRGETKDRGYDVTHAILDIAINPAQKYIAGNVILKFKITKASVSELEVDLVNQLTVDSIIYQGQKTSFTHVMEKIKVPFLSVLPKGTLSEVQIFYHGVPPSGGGFGSFIQSVHGVDETPVLWTLSEPYGAYEWWPCKQTLTDKIDSLDMIVTVPASNKVASNGLLIEESSADGKTKFHWKHRYPIPAYLVAFATTEYEVYADTINTVNGKIPQVNYVYPESVNAAKIGTKNLVDVMHVFNDLFGMYPFWKEKYGHAQFGWGGGMEHTTMTFTVNFNHGLLSHELAHQWFGNQVTCGSWEDIWLNEGFATYLEGLTYENGLGTNTFDDWLINKINTVTSLPGGSVKVQDTTKVGNIFSWRLSYSKGSMVLHMLRWTIGDDAFFQGVNNYLNDPALQYGFALTENLKAHLEATSGKDLTEFFDSWYSGEGHPKYFIDWSQDENNLLKVKIKQAQSMLSADYFKMAVPLQAIGDGIDKEIVLQNDFDSQEYEIQLAGPISELKFDPKHWLVAESTMENVIVGQKKIDLSTYLKLAPNPVQDVLGLSVGELKIESIQIFDLTGKLLLQSNKPFEHQQNIDVSSLKSGGYVLVAQSDLGQASIPFAKL